MSNSLVKNSLIEFVFDIHVNIFINKTLSIIESKIVILTIYTYTLLVKMNIHQNLENNEYICYYLLNLLFLVMNIMNFEDICL